ncbi:THUMP domain-containing protein 1 [Betta splendens]|uniref:THUMP domain-containing protein 1 n=1 Tax=Betta splendens TaxID=158456 RepID=A0A6P7MJJ4_BETSP|nr:THUMP domain-containing protein 1 [Betta splendens]
MSAAQDESRKRNKRRYLAGQQSKRWKGTRQLEVGMRGILITCNMDEKKCMAEALNLLNEYADKVYGPEQQDDNGSSSSEEEDIDAALKKEVAQIQAAGAKQERRFQALDSGANNIIFIRTQNLEPDKLVHHILSDLHSTKKKKSRVILRMLPVSGTCRAYQDDIVKYLTTFLEPWFGKPNCATYQIRFKARNSSHNKRDDVIALIAGIVDQLNPKNKVNFNDPQLTIIVEVIKTVCCFGVVRDYNLYRKYNVQEIIKENAPKPDATAKVDEKPTEQEHKSETNQEEKKGEEQSSKTVQQDCEDGDKGEDGGE